MIFLNGKPVRTSSFPDGTPLLRTDYDGFVFRTAIRWLYDNEAECMTVWHLANHIRGKDPN